jgi:hypothetical protein
MAKFEQDENQRQSRSVVDSKANRHFHGRKAADSCERCPMDHLPEESPDIMKHRNRPLERFGWLIMRVVSGAPVEPRPLAPSRCKSGVSPHCLAQRCVSMALSGAFRRKQFPCSISSECDSFAHPQPGHADTEALQRIVCQRPFTTRHLDHKGFPLEEDFELRGILKAEGRRCQASERVSIRSGASGFQLTHQCGQKQRPRPCHSTTDHGQSLHQSKCVTQGVAYHFAKATKGFQRGGLVARVHTAADFKRRLRIGNLIEGNPGLVLKNGAHRADAGTVLGVHRRTELMAQKPDLAGHRVVADEEFTVAHNAAAEAGIERDAEQVIVSFRAARFFKHFVHVNTMAALSLPKQL